jgi:hypothetical protein
MTVSTIAQVASFVTNGVSASFPYNFPFFEPSDLLVELLNTTTAAVTALTLNGAGSNGYQVQGVQDPTIGEYTGGANVVCNAAPAAGFILQITPNIPAVQDTVFNNNTPFPAKAVEAALDRLTLIAQQQAFANSRAIAAPASEAAPEMVLPVAATRALQFVGFDANGNVIVGLPSNAPVSTAMQPVVAAASTAAALADLGISAGVAAQYGQPWGFSPSVEIGAPAFQHSDIDAAGGAPAGTVTPQPAMWISRNWLNTSDYTPDYEGAVGASMPLVYVQSQAVGGNNLCVHNIMSYGLNLGCELMVGVSGQVNRAQSALPDTGNQSATAFQGQAYNNCSNAGYTTAAWLVIANNVAGTVASDSTSRAISGGQSCALRLSTVSPGAAANVLLLLDGLDGYGAWNGIQIDNTAFPAAGAANTVGINMGNWGAGAAGYAETSVKFGVSSQHLWFGDATNPGKIATAYGGVQILGGKYDALTAKAGVQLVAGGGFDIYLDFFTGYNTYRASIAYRAAIGQFCVNDTGNTDTSINRNGGLVYTALSANGYGVTIGSGGTATSGYMRLYRNTSTANVAVLDVYSDVTTVDSNTFRVSANGNVINTNNSYGAFSDERLKEHIANAPDYLAKLIQLQVRTFAMKADRAAGANQVGLIAQEVAKVFPSLVEKMPDPAGTLVVKYSVLVPILVRGVQELHTRLAAAEKLLDAHAALSDKLTQQLETFLTAMGAAAQKLVPSAPPAAG